MRSRLFFFICLCLWAVGCVPGKHNADTLAQIKAEQANEKVVVETKTLNLVDPTRQRAVPVLLYLPVSGKGMGQIKRKIAILNHGYGGTNSAYSFIANYLVSKGYIVASIQHELPEDEPMPVTGNVYEVRMPFWQRGVQNIQFVINTLGHSNYNLDFNQLLLVGHSNGGDMAMLFAQQYPEQVQKVISLDNRRVPLPRLRKPQMLTLRSTDQSADDGVLPTPEEQEKYGITVKKLKNTIHNDMWDGATQQQKQEMLDHIEQFLQKQ